jgi:hypothetical protein
MSQVRHRRVSYLYAASNDAMHPTAGAEAFILKQLY